MKGFGASGPLVGFLTVGLLLACSNAEAPERNAKAGAGRAVETSASGVPRSDAPRSALPALGSVLVSLSERGVTVRANQASRRVVLAELQLSVGFRLKFAPGTRLEERVTIDAVDAPLSEVLGNLLEGWRYSLHFGAPASGERVLEQVVVGDFPPTEIAAADPSVTTPATDRAAETRPRAGRRFIREVERDPEVLAERRERHERLADEYYAQLDDEDPAVRAQAAEDLTADDRNISALSELAANDPDFRVRAAAVSALGGADTGDPVALGALIGSLGDPDPEVLIPTLESLQWVANSSVISEITPLLDHPNEDVRDTAGITIELLED
jgi:hypothetical protein